MDIRLIIYVAVLIFIGVAAYNFGYRSGHRSARQTIPAKEDR